MKEGEEIAFDVAWEGAIITLEDGRQDRVCLGLNVVNFLNGGGSEIGKTELLSVSAVLFRCGFKNFIPSWTSQQHRALVWQIVSLQLGFVDQGNAGIRYRPRDRHQHTINVTTAWHHTWSTPRSLKLVAIESWTACLPNAPSEKPSAFVEMIKRFGAPCLPRTDSLGPYRND